MLTRHIRRSALHHDRGSSYPLPPPIMAIGDAVVIDSSELDDLIVLLGVAVPATSWLARTSPILRSPGRRSVLER